MSVTYRWTRTVTVASGQVPSPQTDFPTLFSFTHADFKSTGSGGKCRADGNDLNIYSDAALTAIVKTETERYVAATGESIKWGKWSSISDGSVRYYGFGDPSQSSSLDDATNVWSGAIYHLWDGTTLSVVDSMNAHNGTNHSAGAGVGKIDGAATFSTSSFSVATFDAGTSRTYSFWINASSLPSSGNFVTAIGKRHTDPNSEMSVYIGSAGKALFLTFDSTQHTLISLTGNTGISTGTWTHIAATYDGTTGKLYFNGDPDGTQSSSGTMFQNTDDYYFGEEGASTGRYLIGSLDEIHIVSTIRSADWIKIEYNNQSAPGTFLTLASSTQIGIDLDTTSNSGYKTASASYSWSHTCTGSNRYLRVSVSMLSVGGSSVTGITYNSVALTFLGAVSSGAGAVRVEMWGLAAPATGSNTIAVTLSAALDSIAGADSFTYVHQTTSTEGFATATALNGGAADATVNVTTTADLDLVVDAVATSDTAITVGSGQTQTWNVTGTLGSGAGSQEGLKTPAGSVTMSWTNVGAAQTWSIAAIALRPITASSADIGVSSFRSIRERAQLANLRRRQRKMTQSNSLERTAL